VSDFTKTFRRAGDWLVWDFDGRSCRVRISTVVAFGEYGPEVERRVYVCTGPVGEEWQLPPGTKLKDLERELIGGAKPASPEDLKDLDRNMMAMHIDALEAERNALAEAAEALCNAVEEIPTSEDSPPGLIAFCPADWKGIVDPAIDSLRAQLAALRGEGAGAENEGKDS